MLRNLMLRAAANPGLVKIFSSLGSRSGLANRFIAGEGLEDAVKAVQALNGAGIVASLDQLGEGVTDAQQAERAAEGYIRVLERIKESGVQSNISIKLTQLGLDIGEDLCRANLTQILSRAQELGNFVRIDMEDSQHTSRTISLFREQYEVFGPKTVGIVIQSYLRRSEEDVRQLSDMGCNIRLCKGAYKEPPDLAFQNKSKIDSMLTHVIEISLQSRGYTAIASHDHSIIEQAREFVRKREISTDRYEFQMLYGVRRDYQYQLKDLGERMRVYVPFGTEWAPYFMRRLAERPANVLFVTRAIFRG